jgi:hypothetical protein
MICPVTSLNNVRGSNSLFAGLSGNCRLKIGHLAGLRGMLGSSFVERA